MDGDSIEVDWTKDKGMAGCLTSLRGRPLPPDVLLRPLVDDDERDEPDERLDDVTVLVEEDEGVENANEASNKPYLPEIQ